MTGNPFVITKKRLIFRTIILLLSVICFSYFSQPIQAQDLNVSLYPPLLRINIKPGKSITQVFKIDNNSQENKTFIARIVPFSSSDNLGNPILAPDQKVKWLDYFSLANSQIKLDEPFVINANSSEQLILSLSVPDTAPLKDIYAVLLVSTYDTQIDNKLQGSNIRASIGCNLLITVSTQLDPATVLRISEFTPQPGTYIKIGRFYLIDSITPLTFTAIAENEGDFTTETKGLFKIQRGDKNPVILQSILPQFVIGKGQRLLINSDDKQFPFEPSISLIGFYQARIEIHADNANSTSQIDLIFIPAKILLGFFVGLSLLLVIINIAFKPQED